MIYYEWRNDILVRKNSFDSNIINLISHKKWFNKKINSNNSIMLVAELNKNLIGQIRFDVKNLFAYISYSLSSEYRGKGLGTSLLRMGIYEFKKNQFKNIPLIGYVKKNNAKSIKAFESIGFKKKKDINFIDSYKFTLK